MTELTSTDRSPAMMPWSTIQRTNTGMTSNAAVCAVIAAYAPAMSGR